MTDYIRELRETKYPEATFFIVFPVKEAIKNLYDLSIEKKAFKKYL